MKKRNHDRGRGNDDAPKLLHQGELFVTDEGQVVIEHPLKRTRPLLIKSEEAVVVRFKLDECVAPPCAPTIPDQLDWEVFERTPFGHLFLKVDWKVACARTIEWFVYEIR